MDNKEDVINILELILKDIIEGSEWDGYWCCLCKRIQNIPGKEEHFDNCISLEVKKLLKKLVVSNKS